MKAARLLPLAILGLVLPFSQAVFQGCATLIDGPRQEVYVNSHPAGAQVFVNGHAIGQTPATAVVSRWGRHRVRIEMTGYQPFEIPLEKKFNDYAGDNILIGGVWIIVDAMTGAIFRLDVPGSRRAELEREHGYPAIFTQTTLNITTTLKPLPGAKKVGQMERQ